MNITDEQIKRLMHYTRASAERAAAALKEADGDLLDALRILLDEEASVDDGRDPRLPPAGAGKGKKLEGVLRRVWRFLVENRLEAYRPGREQRIECPLAALLALLVLAWYALLFFMILGVCFGWRFRLAGPDLGKDSVNRVVSDLDNAAEGLYRGAVRKFRERQEKDQK